MSNLVFITSNQNKLEEFIRLMDRSIERVYIDLPEIQSVEVEKVVREKASLAYRQIGYPLFVEDSGLYFNALNGLPGALIKSFIERLSLLEICNLIQDDRKAIAETCLAYTSNGKDIEIYQGIIRGSIARKPKGKNGFGWDAIFIPEGHKKTFAEMSKEEKDKISMRKIACDAFRQRNINEKFL